MKLLPGLFSYGLTQNYFPDSPVGSFLKIIILKLDYYTSVLIYF